MNSGGSYGIDKFGRRTRELVAMDRMQKGDSRISFPSILIREKTGTRNLPGVNGGENQIYPAWGAHEKAGRGTRERVDKFGLGGLGRKVRGPPAESCLLKETPR